MNQPRALFRWLILGLGITLVATAFRVTEQVMASMVDHGHDWWRIFVWQLAGWGFWTLAAPALLSRGEQLAASRPWWRALPSAMVVGLALVVVHLLFVTTIVQMVQHFQPIERFSFTEALTRQFNRWRFLDLLAVTGLTGLGMVLASYRQTRQLELRETRLQAELAHAELAALRLQLEPHFVFNALNSIAALIRRGDDDRALQTVLELGEMLRETLGRSQSDAVSLRDEVAFTERYVELQKTRFADRLQAEFDIAEQCLGLAVPTLSLQPLIENSVRHGLAEGATGIRLEVVARRAGEDIELTIRDDGEGLFEGFDLEEHAGVGLGNLRSRLSLMFGDRAELGIRTRSKGGTETWIRMPAVPFVELATAAESGGDVERSSYGITR